MRRDPELSQSFFPVVFAEESYEIATAGEFWLECLGRLAVQAPQGDGAPDLHRSYDELRTIRDDRLLGDRCLGALLDFSDRESKRLVLIAENLNTMFGDMTDPDAGWRLRKILQTEPRFILLASATNRFDQIDNPDEALYELFRVLPLSPLDPEECAVLWETVTGQSARLEAIRALRVLVGGSPRLFVIFARFGAGLSFRQLMADLLELVDDHTEYFRSHLEMLAPQERRVYLALADLWKPATTREVADGARLETSKCSAQLARLVERQIVQVTGGTARRKQYYLTERLYNIYHLLRRPRGPDRLVESLVRFMASYYSPRELTEIGTGIVHAAGSVSGAMLPLERAALAQLLNVPTLGEHRAELLKLIPAGLSEALGLAVPSAGEPKPESLGSKPDPPNVDALHGENSDAAAEMVSRELLDEGGALRKQNRPEEALAIFDEVVRRFGKSEAPALIETVAKALTNKGGTLGALNRLEEALVASDEVVRRVGESEAPALLAPVAGALANKGFALSKLNRSEEALATFGEMVRRVGESEEPALAVPVANAIVNKGVTLATLNRPEEALVAFDEVVRRFGESEAPAVLEPVAKALANQGSTLVRMTRRAEALAVFDEVVSRFGESKSPTLLQMVANALVNKGATLAALKQPEDAMATYGEVVHRFGEHTSLPQPELAEHALLEKAHLELKHHRHEAAIRTAGLVLEQCLTESPQHRLRGHLIRARATIANGDLPKCETDIKAILVVLSMLGSIPRDLIHALMEFSLTLGPTRILEFIRSSPSADVLLPLTTAFEQELGFEPRVAQEVAEVAQDIRRRLTDMRNSLCAGDSAVPRIGQDAQMNAGEVCAEYRRVMADFLARSLALMNDAIGLDLGYEGGDKVTTAEWERDPFLVLRLHARLLMKKARLHVVAVLAANRSSNHHSLAVQMRPALECAGQVVLVFHNLFTALRPDPDSVARYINSDYYQTMQCLTKGKLGHDQLLKQIAVVDPMAPHRKGKKSFSESDTVKSLEGGPEWYANLSEYFQHSELEALRGRSFSGGVTSNSTVYDELAFAVFLEYIAHQMLVMIAHGVLSPATNLETDPFLGKVFAVLAERRAATDRYRKALAPIAPLGDTALAD